MNLKAPIVAYFAVSSLEWAILSCKLTTCATFVGDLSDLMFHYLVYIHFREQSTQDGFTTHLTLAGLKLNLLKM